MTRFPVLLTLHLGPSDTALREFIRLEQPLPTTPLQRVICDNSRYADVTYAAWVNRKIAKGLSCGGGWHERYHPVAVSRTGPQGEAK